MNRLIQRAFGAKTWTIMHLSMKSYNLTGPGTGMTLSCDFPLCPFWLPLAFCARVFLGGLPPMPVITPVYRLKSTEECEPLDIIHSIHWMGQC